MADTAQPRPVREGLFAGDLSDLQSLKLAGSKCQACGEATLGTNSLCPNCGGEQITPMAFSDQGKVWTYTVVRYRPPGDYKGPDAFVPFAMGLVELPEGLRVLAPIGGDIERVRIGMDVGFHPYAREDGVVEFNYAPVA
jgi:uncharacterized OB-fold protein